MQSYRLKTRSDTSISPLMKVVCEKYAPTTAPAVSSPTTPREILTCSSSAITGTRGSHVYGLNSTSSSMTLAAYPVKYSPVAAKPHAGGSGCGRGRGGARSERGG